MTSKQRIITEQETFWAGKFGDDYVSRNQSAAAQAASIAVFASILPHCPEVDSALELGANLGLNLRSLAILKPGIELNAVEINARAAATLKQNFPQVSVHHTSIQDFNPPDKYDIVFTCGVLIHLAPRSLPYVYKKMASCARRYVLMNEYYSPSPIEVPYRGHRRRLFKRDFAGEFLVMFPDWQLRAYGCTYRRDPGFSHDDSNWFVMERKHQIV